MNKKEIKDYVFDNFEPLELLELIEDLLKIVISDVESVNTLEEDVYAFGDGTIQTEDFETIVSACESIYYTIEYNKR